MVGNEDSCIVVKIQKVKAGNIPIKKILEHNITIVLSL